MNQVPQRVIRSFVKRNRPFSDQQREQFEDLRSRYEIRFNQQQPLDLEEIFQNTNPLVLEIGFGMGDSLIEMAESNPQVNYLGIEVHEPGVFHLLKLTDEAQLTNLKVMMQDALECAALFPAQSLSGIQIYFPDPWPKKRHHKRRLVRADTLPILLRCLKPGGFIHCATDWQNYAEQMLEVLSAHQNLQQHEHLEGIPGAGVRPETKFERRGQRLGHDIFDLFFLRRS